MSKNKVNAAKAARRVARKKASEMQVSRMLCVFVISVFALMGFLYIQNTVTEYVFTQKYAIYFLIAVLIGFAATLGWLIFDRVKKNDYKSKTVNSHNTFAVCAVITVMSALFFFVNNACFWNIALTIALTLLYYIWHLYALDFFCLTCFAVMQILFVYVNFNLHLVSPLNLALRALTRVAAVLIPLAVNALAIMVLAKMDKKFLSPIKSFNAVPFIILSLVGIIGTILSFYLAPAPMYTMLALAFAYLVSGIIYTVKMI